MSELIALKHVSRYSYERDVFLSPQLIRLHPSPQSRAAIKRYALNIEPAGHYLNWLTDAADNRVARAVFPNALRELTITVELTAELSPINPFDFFLDPHATAFPFVYQPATAAQLAPYLAIEVPSTKYRQWMDALSKPTATVQFLTELNAKIQKTVTYLKRVEAGVQTIEQTLTACSGSCRDSAWLLVQTLRQFNLAARFVSGYWIQIPPGTEAADSPELHAWAEVYLPGAGWIGLDATTGLLCDEHYIPLAYGITPGEAMPVSGTFSLDASVTFAEHEHGSPRMDRAEFELSIRRIDATPSTAAPIDDAQWAKIEQLAQHVDTELKANDVRLTMGGEPTFVDASNPAAPEWNGAALGPTKYAKGAAMLDELRRRFAPAGLIHNGQGKWYPGEPAPRWALGLMWRGDGEPVWKNPELLQPLSKRAEGLSTAMGEWFLQSLAGELGIDPGNIATGYEDAWYDAWQEQQLPTNVERLDETLRSPADRARSIALDRQGDDQLVGYALPLRVVVDSNSRVRFLSGRWKFRRGKMYLGTIRGPMGGRLPLNAMEWVPPEKYPYFTLRDPNEPKGGLPKHDDLLASGEALDDQIAATASNASDQIVRSAVTAEIRDGALRIFLPPVEQLEAFLALVAAIESAADRTNLSVVLEGFGPPIDSRLNVIRVTPDPGVIEINTHPASDWDELRRNTHEIYQAANACGLVAEKFQYDGRHVGTGGGNHVLLGGATPSDSPILRRPDLLGSLLRYWQNHPSLSYLFSGLFVGPTSQAPRVDEARTDQLHELEIALRQIPPAGTENLPWTIDRLLRNILVDATGNTHRAEFCIDKLFVPETIMGRLGLLELRALEMPPHPRMSLVQLLLIRTLVAMFWKTPYTRRLVRWGTLLHDRFLLPHFVEQDFGEVLRDLDAAGFAFDPSWFAAQLEFRFPIIGSVEREGVLLQLRQAIEPWPVIGDEAAGTARTTDSTLARVQVLLRGIAVERHGLSCNGIRVPLHPTGTSGEYVAGIRYRAWPSPNGLHPTIKPHTPLTLGLIDLASRRSIMGCRLHSADPAGRFYSVPPINAREAETRRNARFESVDHADSQTREPILTQEFAITLDMRLQ